MRRIGILVGAAFLLALGACSSSGDEGDGGGVEVSRSDFGAEWPLTVRSGILNCEGAGAVTFTVNGTTYAVNGLANGMNQWPDIDPLWADSGDGLKKNIGPLIDRGLEICGL